MIRRLALAAIGVCAGAAVATAAPPAPTPSPTPGSSAVDESEIARAIQADQAAQAAKRGPGTSAATPAAEPAPGPEASPPITAGARGFQSLNPDVSAILDLAAGWYSDDAGTIKSGDDPQSTGWKAQEVELALQQVVDPYFRADIYLTIPNLERLEVEEAYLTTTDLPGNLQLKAGVFRAGLGRQNQQHLHVQDFTRRPAINPQLLGTDGMRGPGMEVNWLVPQIPFFLVLSASAFSIEPADVDQPLQTFGGGRLWNFSYVGYARGFFPLSESTSLYAGLDYARGVTSQSVSDPTLVPATATASGQTIYSGYGDNLYGTDLYLKWKPPNQAESYASFAWQTEYFVRQIPNLVVDGVKTPQLEGGLYSQIVVQTHRRIYLGLRGQLMGIPGGDNIKRMYGGALSATWALSEFSRVRLYGELQRTPPFLPLDPAPPGPRLEAAAFVQLEAAIGAHGAHPF